jgi:hypothetical protein
VDPYAELKAAHAAGKVIQLRNVKRGRHEWVDIQDPAWNLNDEGDEYRIKPDDGPLWIEWHGGPCPLTRSGDIIAYRVLKAKKPDPKQPLGPSDVPPFSVVRHPGWSEHGWRYVEVIPTGVLLVSAPEDRIVPFDEMKRDGWLINRPKHRDENGNPTFWEACER